jgi:hypothetical protein
MWPLVTCRYAKPVSPPSGRIKIWVSSRSWFSLVDVSSAKSTPTLESTLTEGDYGPEGLLMLIGVTLSAGILGDKTIGIGLTIEEYRLRFFAFSTCFCTFACIWCCLLRETACNVSIG